MATAKKRNSTISKLINYDKDKMATILENVEVLNSHFVKEFYPFTVE